MPALGDDEASNVAIVRASEYGQCYAKSVPDELYGTAGTTNVFRVEKDRDVSVHSYDWFSQRIFIECNVSDSKTPTGVSVIRLGPWSRGHLARADQLAIAFYFKGQMLKEYSTLDIAGSPENVSASVSHYTVIEKVLGYRRLGGNRALFDVETVAGRTITFDAASGEIVR
jgi:hypothetical protein